MSWRDDTPPPVQDDLDQLVDLALRTAQQLLVKNGEFYPFGCSLGDDGSPKLAAVDPDEGDFPSSNAVLDMLYSGMVARREAIRAAAFVAPVETTEGDAVRVELEHRDGGPPITVLLPYLADAEGASVEFGALTAGQGERHVWS